MPGSGVGRCIRNSFCNHALPCHNQGIRLEKKVILQFSLKKYGVFAGGAALGALVDYVVTLGAVRLGGLSPSLALGLAMLISASAVFLWHDHVTFAAANQPGRLQRYLAFMGWSLAVFLLRAGLLELFGHFGMALPLALAAAILIASVINYVISAALIFPGNRP
ncbi:GtrA family protein [Paracoccus aminovorans]|uniref:GtrA family protein n=1 Tax=Paracoccus aminovorans TaxID=34004 RepID=UPI002B2610BC|nr:GtrA family protein [Paracoccus aminovorans]